MRRGAENSHNYIKFNVSAATMRGLKSLWVQIVIADSYSDELGDENQPRVNSIPPCIVFHGREEIFFLVSWDHMPVLCVCVYIRYLQNSFASETWMYEVSKPNMYFFEKLLQRSLLSLIHTIPHSYIQFLINCRLYERNIYKIVKY